MIPRSFPRGGNGASNHYKAIDPENNSRSNGGRPGSSGVCEDLSKMSEPVPAPAEAATKRCRTSTRLRLNRPIPGHLLTKSLYSFRIPPEQRARCRYVLKAVTPRFSPFLASSEKGVTAWSAQGTLVLPNERCVWCVRGNASSRLHCRLMVVPTHQL